MAPKNQTRPAATDGFGPLIQTYLHAPWITHRQTRQGTRQWPKVTHKSGDFMVRPKSPAIKGLRNSQRRLGNGLILLFGVAFGCGGVESVSGQSLHAVDAVKSGFRVGCPGSPWIGWTERFSIGNSAPFRAVCLDSRPSFRRAGHQHAFLVSSGRKTPLMARVVVRSGSRGGCPLRAWVLASSGPRRIPWIPGMTKVATHSSESMASPHPKESKDTAHSVPGRVDQCDPRNATPATDSVERPEGAVCSGFRRLRNAPTHSMEACGTRSVHAVRRNPRSRRRMSIVSCEKIVRPTGIVYMTWK